MSDDEIDLPVPKRSKVLHYGSLEDQERQRINTDDSTGSLAKDAIEKGIEAGNINITEGGQFDLEAAEAECQAEVLAQFERRKRARTIQVSTDDSEVKANLRQLGEPICLFGEGPADRRERLRGHLAQLGEDAVKKKKEEKEHEQRKKEEENITWYHEGSESLKSARFWLAQYSIPRAKERVRKERELSMVPTAQKNAQGQDLHKKIRSVTNDCSQIGDDRPLSFCQFSPDSQIVF